MPRLTNVWRLGVKELWSLARDTMMLVLIGYTFTVSIYVAATAMPESMHKAPVAIVDDDRSPLSERIAAAFLPPQFLAPVRVSRAEIDRGLDAGRFTFALDIPPDFQRDVLAGRDTSIQLNVDATRMRQAFTGSAYVQQIVGGEIAEFVQRHRGSAPAPIEIAQRVRFNPTLEQSWFGAITEIINGITNLAIVLTGAALIREREHGTVEHLLVMPVTPAEIMLAKVWSMGLVVLAAAAFSLVAVANGLLHVPIAGSLALFLAGCALHLFATTSLGIFMATVARSMPQFGLLIILTVMPLQMLSGGLTPRESMPAFVRELMLIAPTTHFVELGKAVLFRGAGMDVVWPSLLALAAIGSVLFAFALARFRKTIAQMA